MKIKHFSWLLLTVFLLSACQEKETRTIATMDGYALTVEKYIQENSKTPQMRAQLIEQIIAKVALDRYGKEVSNEAIEHTYEETKKSHGEMFEQLLAQEGYTEASLKERIKAELALDEAVKATIVISQSDRNSAWKTYHPEVKAEIAVFDSEDQAKKAREESDLGVYAKESKDKVKGADTNGVLSFDSQSDVLPETVKQAAFELEKDERSEVIKGIVNDGVKNQTYYYVIRMVEPSDPKKKLEDYKTELDQIILTNKVKDEVVRAEAIQQLLAQADVKIVDEDFAGLLDNYHLEKQQPKSWWENITSLWK